jgi:hypothetical protein
MNDFSSSFHPADARPRRRFVLAQDNRPPARARPVVRPGALAAQAAASQGDPCARGEIACRAAWQHVQALGPAGLLALTRDDRPGAGPDPMAAVGMPALGSIAADVEHMLAHGVRSGGARALLLLAVVAAARFDGADRADAVAGAAVTLAQGAEAAGVRRFHAAFMLARTTPFATCLQAFDSPGATNDAAAVLLAAGMSFASGAPLPESLHSLERALDARAGCDRPAQEEATARLALLRSLVVPQSGQPAVLAGAPASFTAASLRLQLAWFDGDRATAAGAALAAASLPGPLAAPADLCTWHLFAVLALAWDAAPQYRHALRWHAGELALAAARCAANAGAMAALAGAVELASAGDVPGALRGYEAAAGLADSHGQAWVAALAWELAAALCQQCAFGAAMPAYRRRALMAWHACGAHGRIARLCRDWNGDDAGARAGWCGDAPAAPVDPQEQEEQRRLARACTVGDLGVSIAHEVNQPLAAILLQAAAARRWLRRPQPDLDKALEALEQIAVSGRRAGDIVRSVQGLARRESNALTWFPLDAALEEVLRLLGRTLRKHGVHAETALELAGYQVRANRAQVQQVVINLLLNAVDALASVTGRERHIVLASRRLGPDTIEISVADNGPGVAPQDRDQIFDALFSTKAHGTGVGLSICRAIAEAHGGHIACHPRTPHGALFALVLAADAAR